MSDMPIYLDYHATTPCDPRVLEAMLPWFTRQFGNASSRQHAYGWQSAEAVKLAREQVAQLIGAEPDEILFTSGATESINLAIKGSAEALSAKGRHIITAQTEHAAVLDTCSHLEKLGFEITRLPVNGLGLVSPASLKSAIRKDTILVAIMMANNETGVIQDISALSSVTRERGVWFFSDATQALGKIPVHVRDLDMMAFSAHKFYGPKGVGALYIRRRNPRVRIMPLLDGGGHERGMRSGTLNVPGIVGMGEAARISEAELKTPSTGIGKLRDEFEQALADIPECYMNGRGAERLPTVSNISFKYTEGAALLAGITAELALSTGSACASASLEPSHVLTAMGLGRDLAYASLRVSFGRPSTMEECLHASSLIRKVSREIRQQSQHWEWYLKAQVPDSSSWSHPMERQ